MPLWLIVGIGSFIGGILRYWISGWIQRERKDATLNPSAYPIPQNTTYKATNTNYQPQRHLDPLMEK
jgi:membrane protein YqaA with SNARE-associated domain